jgi:hypothetical protein
MSDRLSMDLYAIVEREVDRFVLSQVSGIEKCIVREDQLLLADGGQTTVRVLQTQGINLRVFFDFFINLDLI